MLKKFSHIILSMLLLLSTIGVAISKHYCSGNLVSVALFSAAQTCCDDDNCCQSESQFYQLHDDFSIAPYSQTPQAAQFELFAFAVLSLNNLVFESQDAAPFYEADLPRPPKIQTVLSKKQTYLLWFTRGISHQAARSSELIATLKNGSD